MTPSEHPDFTHTISFDEAVAQRQGRAVAQLATDLPDGEEIERAAQEDCETILVRTPGLSIDELNATILRLWTGRS